MLATPLVIETGPGSQPCPHYFTPQVQVQPLLEKEIEIDEFEYNFSATEKPHVRNDTVTLHKRFARDHKVNRIRSEFDEQDCQQGIYEQ